MLKVYISTVILFNHYNYYVTIPCVSGIVSSSCCKLMAIFIVYPCFCMCFKVIRQRNIDILQNSSMILWCSNNY